MNQNKKMADHDREYEGLYSMYSNIRCAVSSLLSISFLSHGAYPDIQNMIHYCIISKFLAWMNEDESKENLLRS